MTTSKTLERLSNKIHSTWKKAGVDVEAEAQAIQEALKQCEHKYYAERGGMSVQTFEDRTAFN